MPISIRHLARRPRRQARAKPVVLDDFRFGLNTAVSPRNITERELSMCINIKVLPLGGLETREGLTRYTTSALANAASHIAYYPLEASLGEAREFEDTDDRGWKDTADRGWIRAVAPSTAADELIVTQPDNKLYYLNTNKAPVLITTLEADATIIPFGDVALILDGSYIKVWDKSTSLLTLAYDDGTGTAGYQHDNTGLTEDTQLKLYSGSNTKAGVRFYTQAWDAGYTITATEVDAVLKKVGSPTGNVGCEIYTDAGVLLATSTTVLSAASIDTTAENIAFTFAAGAMSPETYYWAVVTYSGGDGSNYIQLECDTVASGGDGKYYAGSWNDDSAKSVMMAVKPGRPPRAKFGLINANRVYVAGDPFNSGLMWYCNVNDPYDWSTADGGGYVGAVDDNAMNFAIGAIVAQYGDIYVFGQTSQPYLCKLTGSSPSAYSLVPLFQRIYSTHKTALAIVNDIWFSSEAGTNALSGVEQYGDLRTFTESQSIQDRIDSYWDDEETFAGYYGATGQYFLKLKDYLRVLVVHTKSPVVDRRGRIRYPWTEYVFVRHDLSSSTYKWTASGSGTNEYYCELSGAGDPSLSDPAGLLFGDSIATEGSVGSLNDHEWAYGDNDSLGYSTIYIRDESGDPDTTAVLIKTVLKPTAFAVYQNIFFIACDDGYIYKLDSSVVEDNFQDVGYVVGFKLFESPFNEICLEKYSVLHGTDGSGVTADLEIYDQEVTTDTLDSVAADITESIAFDTRADNRINANYTKFMAVLRNIDPNGATLRINSLQLRMRPLNE